MQRSSHFFTLSLAFISTVGLTACGRQCKQTKERVIDPTQSLMTYLATNPAAAELAQFGCPKILNHIQFLPSGAQTIRSLAQSRFSHANSDCIDWLEDYRYRCYSRKLDQLPVCYRERYRYCSQWTPDTAPDPRYEHALELSRKIDETYSRTQRMCGSALAGQYGDAHAASRDLLHYLSTEVKPESAVVYAQACGKM